MPSAGWNHLCFLYFYWDFPIDEWGPSSSQQKQCNGFETSEMDLCLVLWVSPGLGGTWKQRESHRTAIVAGQYTTEQPSLHWKCNLLPCNTIHCNSNPPKYSKFDSWERCYSYIGPIRVRHYKKKNVISPWFSDCTQSYWREDDEYGNFATDSGTGLLCYWHVPLFWEALGLSQDCKN